MASLFKKLRNAYGLYKSIDVDALNHLAAKVDLPEVMKNATLMVHVLNC